MKLETTVKTITLIPESNEDWFKAGRITRNLGIEVKTNHQRLSETIGQIEIPLDITLNMLSEGIIHKKENWEE